ncbi:uncharacterized protein BJX67DRAFT_347248 [Aspergillus lucknowensis]|uniref:Uncharacterized protein n=1 Tax=Aspergillus lucknowensis TaxID=176173 RepID=A0ABR4M2L2_9EURO
MRLSTYSLLLAAVASIAWSAPAEGQANELVKRQCVDCVEYCCDSHGGCNFLNCAGSTCKCSDAGHCYCQCNCHYG